MQDLVITTYKALEQQSPLNNVHWWRIVLDESQRMKEPQGASAFERFPTAGKLSRVHSWLMSGTPVGSVVEDLLGQVLFSNLTRKHQAQAHALGLRSGFCECPMMAAPVPRRRAILPDGSRRGQLLEARGDRAL